MSAGIASLASAMQEALVCALLDLQQRIAGAGFSGGCTATVVLQVGGQAGQAAVQGRLGWAGSQVAGAHACCSACSRGPGPPAWAGTGGACEDTSGV